MKSDDIDGISSERPEVPKMTWATRNRKDWPLHPERPEVPKMTFAPRKRHDSPLHANDDSSSFAEVVNQLTDEQAASLCELLMARLGWHRDKKWSLRK